MANSVKQKIQLGTLFMFVLLLLSVGVGFYSLMRLRTDATKIIKDNYESLDYCHTMQRILDNNPGETIAPLNKFDSVLKLQEANITEPGEGKATTGIRTAFNLYRSGDTTSAVIQNLHADIQKVLALNMAAIKLKNEKASDTAEHTLTFLSVLAAIIFIIGLTFSYNFPTVLTAPVSALTDGIREIGNKNYQYRIHLDRNDEFGQMARAFNDMAERLGYFESSNLSRIIFEKTRAEAVINSLKEASIGIEKGGIVLFANNQALQLLGMQSRDLVGKTVTEINKRNDLFRFLVEDKSSLPFKIVVNNHENYFTREAIEINQDGSSCTVIVLRNITSFKESDAARSNFINTISHELKIHLSSSDLILKQLLDGTTVQHAGEQKDMIEHLRDDNQRMLALLTEL